MQHANEAAARPVADGGRGWRRRRLLLLAGWIALLVLGSALLRIGTTATGHPGVQAIDRATLLSIDGDIAISLPHQCRPRDSIECHHRLQIAFAAPHDGDERIALFVPNFSGRLQVSLNGTLLADSQWEQAHYDLGRSTPLLVPLPTSLLRTNDSNRIELMLRGTTVHGGAVGTVELGPERLLRPEYTHGRLLTHTLPRLIDGLLLAMAVFVLVVWSARRGDRLYLLYGLMLVAYLLPSLPAYALELQSETLLRLLNVGRFVPGSLAIPIVCLFLGRRIPLPLGWFLLLPALVVLSVLLPGRYATWLVPLVFAPATLLLVVVAIAMLVRGAFATRNDQALLLFGAVLGAAAFAVHDLLGLLAVIEPGYVLLSRFSGPLLAVAIGVILLRRIASSLSAVERFNVRLRQTVEATEAKLRETFAREQEQARKVALETERVRLMSDLHDGIAGHLVSIVALCEQHRAADDEITTASRRALADLRLVVNSLEDMGDDLGLMLAAFREQIAPQLRRAGVGLDWQVRALPDLPGLHPTATLTIFRILQEAVMNAIRHAGGDRITIDADSSPRVGFGVRLRVRDHGRGGASGRPGGFGIDNMQRRASAIGAALDIDSTPQGTTVKLDLPARLDAGATESPATLVSHPARAGSASA